MLQNSIIKKIITIILYGIGVVVLVFLKLILNNFAPLIFSVVDILMLFFVIAIMRGREGGIVWFAFCVYFLLDILASQTSGVGLFAGVFSILGVFWFFKEIFTNLSIWTAGILTVFGTTVFRVLYSIGTLLSGILLKHDFIFSSSLFKQYGIEILATSLLSIPLYAIYMKIGNIFTRERIRYS